MQIFLAPHASFFDLDRKRAFAARGMGLGNPFVDPEGYKAWVERMEGAFRDAVALQKEEAPVKGE